MNSKARCKGCKQYRYQKVMRKVGLSYYCPTCKPQQARNTTRRSESGKHAAKSIPPWLRQEVLDRDGRMCRWCGTSSGVELHHILYRSQQGKHENGNLITLCGSCHKGERGVHSNKALYQPVLRAIIWRQYVHREYVTVPQMMARLGVSSS